MCEPANSPICQKWTALGGDAVLGAAVGGPELVLGGKTTLQRFEKGAIFLTHPYGAIYLSKELFKKWEELKSQPSIPNNSDDLQTYLGCPLKDTFPVQEGEAAYFEKGMLFVRIEIQGEFDLSRRCVVYGDVYGRYVTTGDVNGPLGVPFESTSINSDGALVSHFDNGSIYAHQPIGIGTVGGKIRARWQELGAVSGVLGYPTTDEKPVLLDSNEIGRTQRFQNGSIYFSDATGAWEVMNPILKAWEEQFGGALGELGFPISGQRNAPKTNKIFNNFEHGVLVWNFDAALEKRGLAIKTLEFFVKRFAGTGGDEIGSSGLEVYVHSAVATHLGVFFTGRFPEAGFFPAEKDVDITFGIPGIASGELVVAFDFQGRESDTGPDDTLGHITGVYDIDNGWDLDKGLVQFDNDAFHMTAGMRFPGEPLDPTKPFRGQAFWSFANFTTDDLSDQQYAATFRDIDAGELVTLNPATWLNESWEGIFYHLVYKDMCEDGNCLGICVESIYAEVNRSFFTEPIFQFPGDAPGLQNEINIKHGYQAGASVIDWFVGQFLTGNTHDPVDVFAKTRDAFNGGDYPIISMSSTFFAAGGHVVRPYRWDDSNPSDWIIFVANPNFPAGVRADDAEGCVIHIDPEDNSFRFQMSDGEVWEGGAWLGSRMHYIPYSQLSTEPRTPGYEVLALLASGVWVIAASAGQTKQISDQSGTTFFEPDLPDAPTKWEEIRRDGGLLGSVALMPAFSGSSKPFPQMYFVRDTVGKLQHRIAPRPETPADAPYHWLMTSPTLSAAIALQAGSSLEDTVTVDRIGGLDPAVSLSTSPDAESRKTEIWLMGWRGRDHENDFRFHLHDFTVAPGQTVSVRLNEGGRELVVNNDGPQISCQITVNGSATQEVLLKGGEATSISPVWNQLDQPWVVEKADASLRHFMEGRGLQPQLGLLHYFSSVPSLRQLMHV